MKIKYFVKNPILIKNSYSCSEITKKILKQLILEDLDNFLEENKTVSIIIVKKNDKYIMECCSDERILTREYLFV